MNFGDQKNHKRRFGDGNTAGSTMAASGEVAMFLQEKS